jgi:Na+-transporting methylmalonyl-CoA/oxaloacetate decarboxylase gamma subunit
MLLESIILTVAGIKDYIILLSLFIYVWALLGMSFFAGKVKFDGDGKLDLKSGTSPRTNFDKWYNSFLTVF